MAQVGKYGKRTGSVGSRQGGLHRMDSDVVSKVDGSRLSSRQTLQTEMSRRMELRRNPGVEDKTGVKYNPNRTSAVPVKGKYPTPVATRDMQQILTYPGRKKPNPDSFYLGRSASKTVRKLQK